MRQQLQSITRTLPLTNRIPNRTTALALPRAIFSISNRYNYSTEAQEHRPQPKILDAAGMYDGNKADVEKHNKDFENRGEGGPPGKVARGKSGGNGKPGPKIHNTAGVFDGEKRDVEEHNRVFKERHDRGD